METLLPRYKMLITYDIQLDKFELYYRYILGEFVPALRELGLHMTYAWHVPYGHYPARMIEFICENRQTLDAAMADPRWQALESRLQSYTTDYRRKVVYFADRFQM